MYLLEMVLPIFITGYENGHSHGDVLSNDVNKNVEMNNVNIDNHNGTVLQESSVMLDKKTKKKFELTPIGIMVIIGKCFWHV